MNKDIEEQTDSLESIINEVTKLNELVYAGALYRVYKSVCYRR